jgi:cysteine synthase B
MTELVGNTPIIKLDPKYTGLRNIDLYAKLEYLNPFGSLKDRTAYGMIKDELEYIKENNLTVIETSSGNTAKGLCCISAINDIKFLTVTNRIKLSESKNILKFIGAEVKEVSKGINTVAEIKKMIEENPGKYYHTTQYTNENNVNAHYNGTAKEIVNDIGKVDYFISVLGTSGSSTGTSKYLKEVNCDLINIGVVTKNNDYIPGIRTAEEMEEVGIFKYSNYDDILDVSSKDAKDYMRVLCRDNGVLVGPSTGASFAASIKYLQDIDEKLTERKKAVFIACDRLETYANFINENKFYKYHVLGNKYIVIDPNENYMDITEEKVKEICNKDYGVGADGIIYGPIKEKGRYDFKVYNPDGSKVNMAIFASKIFAKYLRDKNIEKSSEFSIYLEDKEIRIEIEDKESTIIKTFVNGYNVLEAEEGKIIEIGNKNLVIEESELSKEKVIELGRKIHLKDKDLNVIIMKSKGKVSEIEAYERGAGYTVASGTSALAAVLAKGEKGTFRVKMQGGNVDIINEDIICIKAEVYKVYEGEL